MESLISSDVNVDALAKRLKQFYSGEVEAKKVIKKYLEENPRVSTAEAFRVLSSGKGSGKSRHFSTENGEVAIHTRGSRSSSKRLRGPFFPQT